ncbi:MAG: tRNA (adenosine(37)-N6)-threonylcarbamoyltransferase complex dimerization subunit type 1 TsaB, partial [Boseongicola sp.]|nr:tRNA (adenosine(37)-N6)-threonylcarbamoyltransferase complex dimerization subunit type 1 TsaB [Boseongicola sp.]
MKRGQAERLMPMLDEVLSAEGAVFEELDAIGVGVGPGNFTGIRISVSAARGLALALGVPAVGVSAFDVLRGAAPDWVGPELVSIPSQRRDSDVVLQRFEAGRPVGAPFELKIFGTHELDVEAFPAEGRILGAECAALNWIFCERFGHHATYDDPNIEPVALAIARAAAKRLLADREVEAPAPVYIRPADAAPASDPPPVILP